MIAPALTGAYARRPLSTLGVRRVGDWMVKTYGISYGKESPREELIDAALSTVQSTLEVRAVAESRYGVGFVGIHDGRDSNFVFVSWWESEDELHHHVFISPSDEPANLRRATQADAIACVWDLHILAHEREAWISHVLANPGGPDLEAYLADTISGRV